MRRFFVRWLEKHARAWLENIAISRVLNGVRVMRNTVLGDVAQRRGLCCISYQRDSYSTWINIIHNRQNLHFGLANDVSKIFRINQSNSYHEFLYKYLLFLSDFT